MKTAALLILFAVLASCTTTKTTATENTPGGKVVTETTSQKVDAPSVLEIIGGVVKAATTLIGL